MRYAVLYSKNDLAGISIAEQLKSLFLPQIPIIKLSKETIYSENIDKSKKLRKADFIVFASKHVSKDKKETFSLHAPGNWREADFGGKPGKVCSTSALILKYLFQELNKNNNLNYGATLECTHHGPYIEKPCLFIEIGSSERQWKDEQAASVIAKTIASLQNFEKRNKKIAIGIGNGHYCPNFNKIQLNSEYAVSHIIPEYSFPLTSAMLKEAIDKTEETSSTAIVDWKGCGKSEEREKVLNIIKKSGLEIKRTSEIEK